MKIRPILFIFLATAALCTACADNRSKLERFWDGYDFASTAPLDDIGAARKRFEKYVALLEKAPEEDARRSIEDFIKSTSRNEVSLYVYSEWFETYLYALESPYRNEKLFDAFMGAILAEGGLNDDEKVRFEYLRRLSGRNKEGTAAEDFVMCDAEGNTFELSAGNGERRLLLFLDTECPSCLETAQKAAGSAKVRRAVENGTLRLYAVAKEYDKASFDLFRSKVGGAWMVVYNPDGELIKKELYDMALTPSFYLIAPDGKVEVKCAPDLKRILRKL